MLDRQGSGPFPQARRCFCDRNRVSVTLTGYANVSLSEHPFGPHLTLSHFVISGRRTDISPPRLVGVPAIKKKVSVLLLR